MYVCICNAVTEADIRAATEEGATTMRDLSRTLGVGRCCGHCVGCARECLEAARAETEPAVAA